MVFYFTGTGNSKYCGERLVKEFGGNLIDMAKAIDEGKYQYDVPEGEIVFFVFPIHYYGVPHLVVDFVKKLTLNGTDIQCCGVGTCGGSSGATDRQLKKLLKERGYEMKAFYQIKMPENYIVMFNVPLKEEQIMIMRRADKAIDEMIDSINYKFRVSYRSNPGLVLFSKIAQAVYKNGRPAKKFYADDKCISCGLCEKVCTDKIIKMKDGKPEWTKDRCCHCMACISRCPAQSIQYGKKTESRVRYINSSLE